MLSKKTWLLFVPLAAAACFFKLAQTVFPDRKVLGWSDRKLDYAVIGCAALIFLFAMILCLCDRKISKYYLPHRNFAAGIFGVLLALVLAADGSDAIYLVARAEKLDVLKAVEAGLLVFGAIVFVVMGLNHSFTTSNKKVFALLYVVPALMCAIRLVCCFVEFTTISILLADVTRLFCYVFATMFFFNYAVALSLTEAKNAVKSCFIYGFPAAAQLIAHSAGSLYANFDTENLVNNAQNAEIGLMGLYILAFLIELTIFVKDKDHVVIKDEDDVDYKDLEEDELSDEEDFVVTGVEDEDRAETPASSYISTADTSNFLYQETHNDDDRDSSYFKAAIHDVDDFITDEVESVYKEDGKDKSYADQLDEIDKLILEISAEE